MPGDGGFAAARRADDQADLPRLIARWQLDAKRGADLPDQRHVKHAGHLLDAERILNWAAGGNFDDRQASSPAVKTGTRSQSTSTRQVKPSAVKRSKRVFCSDSL